MLNLSNVKTRTLYSKQQIQSLYSQFKQKLNLAYAEETPAAISDLLTLIKLFYYLAEIPCLLRELNEIGEIKLLAALEILFMKSSPWKQAKEQVQTWVGALSQTVARHLPPGSYSLKPQIATVAAAPDQTPFQFYAQYLEQVAASKSQDSMVAAISFLRVFVIDQLQNKRREIVTVREQKILPEWQSLNQSIIRICGELENIKYEEICVSVCYWLCSNSKQFIRECVNKGIVTFLCQSLISKNISQWYGRKILSFLKLLILGLEGDTQCLAYSDIESCAAQFTLRFDNINIMQQARSLFSCLKGGEGKVRKQAELFQKYNADRNARGLQGVVKNARILLLYSEDEAVKRELRSQASLQFFLTLVKNEQNLALLTQTFNIIAYNNFDSGSSNPKQSLHDMYLVQRVSSVLSNNVYKAELTANNKKILVSLIRMLKQLIQSRQGTDKLRDKIKAEGLVKKFNKFSDCTNFQYERELLSLSRALSSNAEVNSPQKKSEESTEILFALVKHMNERPKKMGRRLEEDLEQVQLLYEMLQRGQALNIKPETVSSIFDKIRLHKTETEEVQIAILDKSQEQRNRELLNKINFYALASLYQLQKQHKAPYSIRADELEKVVNVGLSTDENEVLKADTRYLAALYENGRVLEGYESKVVEVYRKYKEVLGEDSQVLFKQIKQSKVKEITLVQSPKQKSIAEIIQQSLGQKLSEQQLQNLSDTIMNEQSVGQLRKLLGFYSKTEVIPNNACGLLLLKFILKLSQIEQLKMQVFNQFHTLLSGSLSLVDQQHRNLIFRIYNQLYEQAYPDNPQFFQQELSKSYAYLSNPSVEFTNTCLGQLQDSSPPGRREQYWKFIYNDSTMISRQAQLLLKGGDGDRFWGFFARPIEQNVQDQRKMTLNFLDKIGDLVTPETWDNNKLQRVLQHVINAFRARTEQLKLHGLVENTLRKIGRLAKVLRSVTQNQSLGLGGLLPVLYQQICTSLSEHPTLTKANPTMKKLNEEYLLVLLQSLNFIFRRRQSFSVVRKSLSANTLVAANIAPLKGASLNDEIALSCRILFLRDDKHEEFKTLIEVFNQAKQAIGTCVEKGKQHLEACERIIEAVSSSNQGLFKKQYLLFFFPGQQSKQSHLDLQMSDEELLRHLKNLLSPPYQYGINLLEKKLKLVQSNQFANTLVRIFIQSEALYDDDKQNQQKTLEQVQKKVADCIWGPGCQLNSDFYKMINMNLVGLRVALKTKGIGLEGTAIVCEKFYQHPEQVPLCAEILFLNVTTSKEWGIVYDKRVFELANQKYKKRGREPEYGRSLANFIGSSSKLKAIQSQYKIQEDLIQNLDNFAQNTPCLASTLYALSGLVYLNEVNQRVLGTKQCILKYLSIIEVNAANASIFQKGCNLLSNLVYKNTSLVPLYLELQVEKKMVAMAASILYSYAPYKQFLRLVGNLSLSLEAASSISATQFLYLWNNIVAQSEANKNEDVTKYAFDVIYNLLNYHEVEARAIAYKVNEAQCGAQLIGYLQRNSLASAIVESGLDALEKVFIIEANRRQGIDSGVLKCLEDLAKTQSWNQNVLERWLRVVFSLSQDSQTVTTQMMKSEIFLRYASFIRQHPQIKHESLNLAMTTCEMLYQKCPHGLFASAGVIDLMVDVLKIKGLKNINASTLIDCFCRLHEQKVLAAGSYTKVFGGLMARLQFEFRDENSKKIISAITKIREKIVINTRAASILLEFAGMFLTQSEIITSHKYQKRVREFICLLSYFISFSIELKLIFREQEFITILNSWIKIDKSLDEDNSVSEACRVCIFTILNEQRFLVALTDKMLDKAAYLSKLSKPVKCLLYRRNSTNKPALLQMRASEAGAELVAYKAPDGEIKQKYTIPIVEVIGMRVYESSEDPVLRESVFATPGSLFQKSAVALHCVSFVAIVGEQLSIRQIDVEFGSQTEKEDFVAAWRELVSLEFRARH